MLLWGDFCPLPPHMTMFGDTVVVTVGDEDLLASCR